MDKIYCTLKECKNYKEPYDCAIRPKCDNPKIPDFTYLHGYFLKVWKDNRTGKIFAEIIPPEVMDMSANNYTPYSFWRFELKNE